MEQWKIIDAYVYQEECCVPHNQSHWNDHRTNQVWAATHPSPQQSCVQSHRV